MSRERVSASDVQAELDDFDAELELRREAAIPPSAGPGCKRQDIDAFTEGLERCQHGVGHIAVDAELYRIAGLVWNCTDVLSGNYCQLLDLPAGSSYAQAARCIRAAGRNQSGGNGNARSP